MRAHFDEVDELKQRARQLNRAGLYERAQSLLAQTIDRLQAMMSAATDEAVQIEIRTQLSDVHAMKGSVHSRSGDLTAALAEYRAALAAEVPSNQLTYNLLNIILLSICLAPKCLKDGSLAFEFDTLHKRLETSLQGPGRDSWWHWADMIQLSLLEGRLQDARRALRHGLAIEPGATQVQCLLDQLTQLGLKLELDQPEIAEKIREFLFESQTQANYTSRRDDA